MTRRTSWVAGLAALGMATAGPAYAQAVVPTTGVTQLIGAVIAGDQYMVTASGTVALCPNCNGGNPLTFNPDGALTTPGVGAFSAFNSGPKDYDPSNGAYGAYGPGTNFAELYGTFNATPAGSDLFAIGFGTTFTASASGLLYGVINDDDYGDNSGAYNVTLSEATPAAVPEPASWAMMISGFGLVGGTLRRRPVSGAAALA